MVCWSLQFSVTPPTLSVSGLSSSFTSPRCFRLLSGISTPPFLFNSTEDSFFLLLPLRLFFLAAEADEAVSVVSLAELLGLFLLFFMITGCCGGSKLIKPLASNGWRSPIKKVVFSQYHTRQNDFHTWWHDWGQGLGLSIGSQVIGKFA